MSGGRVVVFGAGGHGKVVADVARSAGFTVAAFGDDSPARAGTTLWDLPVVSWERFLAGDDAWRGAAVAMGVGDNRARQACQERVAAAGLHVVTVVHARATLAPTARIAAGSVVMAGAVVNPDASVGRGCILNTGCVVEHDCRVGDFAHLSPNAALGGTVTIGERSHLGLGAVVLPGVRVGSDVRVGAGAAVVRDVADALTVVGVPAAPVQHRKART